MDTTPIGDVAALAGITVRTLHHYDEIGLLVPSERKPNGYRAYTDADIDRLQQILTYRELDLSLEEIAAVLDTPTSRARALETARARIAKRINKLHRISESLDAAIRSEEGGTTMTPQERLRAFGDFDPEEHAEEVEQQWGDTPQFAESVRRTNRYTTDDWQEIRAEGDEIYAQFLSLMANEEPADSPVTAHMVDAHRQHISKWFYECTPEIHFGLGDMYVADQRFATNIDRAGDGLAAYMSEAIAARY